MEAPSTSGRDAGDVSRVQARLRSLPLFARDFIAGGVAGGVAKTCMAPLERTKILFQTRGTELQSVAGTLRMMWSSEGVWGLFKGNGASVLRIVPYAAIHFSSYEYYKRAIHAAADSSWPAVQGGRLASSSSVWDLLAGGLSGATAVAATYPLDLVRTRLAWATEWAAPVGRGPNHHHHHPTVRSVLRRTIEEEGVRGLYRGVVPTALGILPYAGLKFYTYQLLKNHYKEWQAQQRSGAAAAAPHPAGQQHAVVQPQQQQQQRMPLHMAVVFGGISGLVGQTLTYPLDVIRRQMQVEGVRQLHATEAAPLPSSSSSSSSGGGSGSGRLDAVVSSAATASSSGSGSSNAPPAARSHSHQAHSLLTGFARQPSGLSGAAALAAAGSDAQSAARVHSTGGGAAPRPPVQRQGIKQVASALVAQAGWRGLFRGLSLNYIKVVPSTAIGWTVYEASKAYLGCASNL